MVPCGPLARLIAGVDVIPTSDSTWPQPLSESEGLSPEARDTDQSGEPPASASKAYRVSFSVATYKTLCVPPEIETAGTYRGCASTWPSSVSLNSKPKLADLTLAGESSVSSRFCPVRAASLCHVSTPWADKPVAHNRAMSIFNPFPA